MRFPPQDLAVRRAAPPLLTGPAVPAGMYSNLRNKYCAAAITGIAL